MNIVGLLLYPEHKNVHIYTVTAKLKRHFDSRIAVQSVLVCLVPSGPTTKPELHFLLSNCPLALFTFIWTSSICWLWIAWVSCNFPPGRSGNPPPLTVGPNLLSYLCKHHCWCIAWLSGRMQRQQCRRDNFYPLLLMRLTNKQRLPSTPLLRQFVQIFVP